MYLGLKTGSLCPMGALVLHSSSRVPPDSVCYHNLDPKESPNYIKKKCFVSRAPLHLSFKSPGKGTPSTLPNWYPYGESCPFPEPSFSFISNSSINVLPIQNKFLPSLEGPRKGASPMFPENGAPMERDAHFLSLTWRILQGPQVPLTDLPQREMLRFQSPPSFIGDRGGPVVKVLCYKSEGRWFHPADVIGTFHWHKILPIALWPWGLLSL